MDFLKTVCLEVTDLFRGSGRKKLSGLSNSKHSDMTSDIGQRIVSQATAGNYQLWEETECPAANFAHSKALLASRGSHWQGTPCAIHALVFITPAIRQHLATCTSPCWCTRAADSHCFVPLLKHCEHTKHAPRTHSHTGTWCTAFWLHPLLWQALHWWVCGLGSLQLWPYCPPFNPFLCPSYASWPEMYLILSCWQLHKLLFFCVTPKVYLQPSGNTPGPVSSKQRAVIGCQTFIFKLLELLPSGWFSPK